MFELCVCAGFAQAFFCCAFSFGWVVLSHPGEKKIKETEEGWTTSLQLPFCSLAINVNCGFGSRVPHLKLADVEYQNYPCVVDQPFPNPLLSVR